MLLDVLDCSRWNCFVAAWMRCPTPFRENCFVNSETGFVGGETDSPTGKIDSEAMKINGLVSGLGLANN